MKPAAEPQVSIRLPDALDAHMFNGMLQPGDQIVTSRFQGNRAAFFVWHDTSTATTAIDKAIMDVQADAKGEQAHFQPFNNGL